jgi:RsiW-degrading membrane proteinase PrsW (M82 family)
MIVDLSTILYALAGGILPAVFWLVFWLREDERRPEPRRLIARTFILGMCSVIVVIPFQRVVGKIFMDGDMFPANGLLVVLLFLLWAIVEEIFKFGAAYMGGLKEIDDNEPIDPMIYMITAALGFVALENTLFIFNPLLQQDLVGGLITGNFRFIGSSLLHILSSSMIGAGISVSFYQSKKIKKRDFLLGFIIAVLIHTVFNMFILSQQGYGVFKTFGILWLGVMIMMLLFEKVKGIKPDVSI